MRKDHCRSIPGFGTVVSGTILSGRVRVNDTVQLMPSGKEAKARFLESHHIRLDEATAGQRVGINLNRIIGKLCNENRLVKTEKGLKIPNMKAGSSSHQGEIIKSVMEYARCCGYSTFGPGTFYKLNSGNLDYGSIQRAINFLCSQKKLLKLRDGRVLNAEALPEIQAKIRELIVKKGSMSVHDTKSILGYGRSKAIPVLDYLDSIGFTLRDGDLRILNPSYCGEDSVKSIP